MPDTLNPVTVRPSKLRSGVRLGFKVIAVIGYADDWTAYQGLTEWSDEAVVSYGDKLPQQAAEALFYAPVAAGLHYRT